MPNLNTLLPPPSEVSDEGILSGRQQFLELYGSTLVMNNYLKVAVLCLALVSVGSVMLSYKAFEAARNLKPLVIRISDFGDVGALRYSSLEYQPREPEIKYFLMQFVQQHYGRMRATVQDNFAKSLFFLDGALTHAIIEKNKKSLAIESAITGQSDEIDVRVKAVSIEDLSKAPYRATVEYEKVYLAASTRQETKRERFIGNFVFTFKEQVTNAMIPVNPLGFTITYFREDQAFQ